MTGMHGRQQRLKAPRAARWVAVLLLLLIAASAAAYAYAETPPDRIAKGVSAGSVALGGLTTEEARAALDDAFGALSIPYAVHDASVSLAPDGKFATLNAGHVADLAFQIGRGEGSVRAALARMSAAVVGRRIPLTYSFDDEAFRAALTAAFDGKIDPPLDAKITITLTGGGAVIAVAPEHDGLRIDFDAVASLTRKRIEALETASVEIAVRQGEPRVRTADVEPFKPAVLRAVARAPLSVTAKGETWTVSKALIADWIVITADGGPIRPALDRTKAGQYVESRGVKYAVAPTDAVFEEVGGKVAAFTPAQDGEALDVSGSIDAIETALFSDAAPKGALELVMTVVPPKVSTEASNPYGIKDVIGVGETNFAGSPTNRRHNIGVGAAAVGGTLIPPGEEFSMLKTLGTIDGTTGYREELVIKGNRTIPEYGGGLCQIGSTAFRATLASGLPVTVRQNHSYRVPYYERDGDGNYIGPGKDATIYNPAPDYRFLNDTGHHVLITTAIEGNRLSFIFWGVSDGRKAEQTDARVYNVVPPPPKKVTKTTSLAPGVEKCTERAHAGSDAVFTYTVTYAEGEKKEVDFRSRYRPWQEVCLLGVTQAELDAELAASEVDEHGAVIPPSADAAGATGN